jgi:CheY-like chemotaxis protein
VNTQPRPIEILLVEDNPADARLTSEMLKEARVANRLTVAGTGADALRLLLRQELDSSAPRPDLILLDLNLPGISGQEVLGHVKSHPDLRRIPVVILTSSRAEQDVRRSYDLHANAYVVKPVDLTQFTDVVQSIEDFWLAVVKLPAVS